MEIDTEDQKMNPERVGWRKMGEEEKMAAVNEEMNRLRRLPPHSSYASHRLRVLHKIHHLLALNLQRTTSQEQELELLFSGLRL